MLEHEARSASTQQTSGAPAALEETHTRPPIVLLNCHRLSIDRDIEGSFRGPKQARKDDEKPETRGLRKKPDRQYIADRRIPNHPPAAVTSDELSCYGHADDRAGNDADQHKGE
jgi:hypothetical protein